MRIGNSDLTSTTEPIGIACNIIDLAKKVHIHFCNAIISEILPRGDKLNEKAQEVNNALHEIAWTMWIRKSVDNKTSKF